MLLALLLTTITIFGQTSICIIGTYHEENKLVNADTLFNIFKKIKPDVILIELDSSFFTKNFEYDLDKYTDLLSTNENISSYRYKQKYSIAIRPYDISGRNEFYIKESYHEKENGLFKEMLGLYENNELSGQCKLDFEILFATLDAYSKIKYTSLKDVNSDIMNKFTSLKYKVSNELIISIVDNTPKLNKWKEFARLRKDFWDVRNETMVKNIIGYMKEFENRIIVVLTGFEHKYYLEYLLERNGIKTTEFWEFLQE